MEILFWILVSLVFYTYLGYGIFLFLVVRFKRFFSNPQSLSHGFEPKVTLVIPAYNEEEYITEKAENSLALDYPKEKLRILFITDGSTDGTVKKLQAIDGVEVNHSNRRAGKSAAENRAMQLVETEYVVFCDANTQLNRPAIRELVKHYQDPRVGAVAGEKKIITAESANASTAGEGIYWKYESQLKKWDSELYSVVGAAGELISFRSKLVEDLEEDTILDDFIQSLRICKKGYRVKYEPKAFAFETASASVSEEYKRKTRIAAGGWQAMYRLRGLLNPLATPLVLWWQYVSHRVLRWSLSAFALPFILVLNLLLSYHSGNPLYDYILVAQVLFYGLAIIGWALERKNIRVKILFVPFYFTMMNYSVFVGVWRYITNSQAAAWEKSKRATL